MPDYAINDAGVAHARELIDARHYDLKTPWAEAAPSARAGNHQIDKHGWAGYGQWHLAVDSGASEETKNRYGFPYGDFRRVNRAALIHAEQRASQNDHGEVARVAAELLAALDEASGR